jgi:hypothetical protein
MTRGDMNDSRPAVRREGAGCRHPSGAARRPTGIEGRHRSRPGPVRGRKPTAPAREAGAWPSGRTPCAVSVSNSAELPATHALGQDRRGKNCASLEPQGRPGPRRLRSPAGLRTAPRRSRAILIARRPARAGSHPAMPGDREVRRSVRAGCCGRPTGTARPPVPARPHRRPCPRSRRLRGSRRGS